MKMQEMFNELKATIKKQQEDIAKNIENLHKEDKCPYCKRYGQGYNPPVEIEHLKKGIETINEAESEMEIDEELEDNEDLF